ncbi:MAG: hypothetical protein MJ168_07680, partial [Clostridia bacterium]|nr:hypothetical protein [Clostridia bacterium]
LVKYSVMRALGLFSGYYLSSEIQYFGSEFQYFSSEHSPANPVKSRLSATFKSVIDINRYQEILI